MTRPRFYPLLRAAAIATVALALCGAGSSKKPKTEPPLPAFDIVERIVNDRISERKLDRGDIISQGDVKPVFSKFAAAGWKVADEQEIMGSILPDTDFLVGQLRSPQGRQLAHQLAPMPGGFDRADRLRRLIRGEKYLADMVRGPDGYKLFQYMTETTWGANLGNMLSQDPGGKGFNSRTGTLYTSADLLKRLRQSYDKTVEARQLAQAKARFGR